MSEYQRPYCEECDGGIITVHYVGRDEFGPKRVEIRDEDGIALAGGGALASENADLLSIGAEQDPEITFALTLGSSVARAILLWESTKGHNEALIREAEDHIAYGTGEDVLNDELVIRKILYGEDSITGGDND